VATYLIPAGDVPMRLLYQLYVFENWLYRVNMTGEQLRIVVDFVVQTVDFIGVVATAKVIGVPRTGVVGGSMLQPQGAEVRDLIPAGDVPMRLLYQLYVFENWLYRVNMPRPS